MRAGAHDARGRERSASERARLWTDVEHPRRGKTRVPNSPIRLHGTAPGTVERVAPLLGQDTDRVLAELLGLKAEELAALHAAGVIEPVTSLSVPRDEGRPSISKGRRVTVKLGMFTMPFHHPSRDYATILQEDQEAILLADRLGFTEAYVGVATTGTAARALAPVDGAARHGGDADSSAGTASVAAGVTRALSGRPRPRKGDTGGARPREDQGGGGVQAPHRLRGAAAHRLGVDRRRRRREERGPVQLLHGDYRRPADDRVLLVGPRDRPAPRRRRRTRSGTSRPPGLWSTSWTTLSPSK